MPAFAVLGGQWGDEGKGKIVDLLAQDAGIITRFSGGDNAGHTIINPHGEFKLHLIPSGIFAPHAISIIGNGVVINPVALLDEIDQLNQHGVDTSRLFISDRAHLVMPYHLLLDGLEEKRRGGQAIGTTGKGIGPAFADKIARTGIRTSDLLDKEAFRERLRLILEYKNSILTKVYEVSPLSLYEVHEKYCRYGERMAPYIKETTVILAEALDRGEMVLLEGAQGAMLDPDFDDGQAQGDYQRKMSKLGHHGAVPAVPVADFAALDFFSASATSGGIYFSSCFASTSSAMKTPPLLSLPCATMPCPSRNRSGRMPVYSTVTVFVKSVTSKRVVSPFGSRCTLPFVTSPPSRNGWLTGASPAITSLGA